MIIIMLLRIRYGGTFRYVHGQFDRARSLGLPRQSGRVHVLKPLGHGLAPLTLKRLPCNYI